MNENKIEPSNLEVICEVGKGIGKAAVAVAKFPGIFYAFPARLYHGRKEEMNEHDDGSKSDKGYIGFTILAGTAFGTIPTLPTLVALGYLREPLSLVDAVMLFGIPLATNTIAGIYAYAREVIDEKRAAGPDILTMDDLKEFQDMSFKH